MALSANLATSSVLIEQKDGVMFNFHSNGQNITFRRRLRLYLQLILTGACLHLFEISCEERTRVIVFGVEQSDAGLLHSGGRGNSSEGDNINGIGGRNPLIMSVKLVFLWILKLIRFQESRLNYQGNKSVLFFFCLKVQGDVLLQLRIAESALRTKPLND